MIRKILLLSIALTTIILTEKANAQTAPIGGGYSNSAILSDSGFVFWAGQTPGSTTFTKVLKGEQTGSTSGYLEQIKAIYTGSGNHILAVDCNGSVYAWGNNANGQLGNGASGTGLFTTTPVRVLKGEQASSTAYLENVSYISTGNEASYALLNTGNVMAWGNGANGRLGNGGTASSTTPVYVRTSNGPPIVYLDNVVQIGGMENAAAALKSDGTVWTWGSNGGNECGTAGGGSLARQVTGLPPIVKITTGDFNVMALDADGQIWIWGTNSEGTLGDGLGAGGRVTAERVLAVGAAAGTTNYLTGVREMAAGQFMAMALMNDGRVVSWGKNRENSTGHNTVSYVPKYVIEPDGTQLDSIIYIATGDGHGMAMDQDGDLYTWGWNGNGQLGLGDATNRNYATKVSNLPFGVGFPCPVAFLGPDVVLCNPVTATLYAGSHSPSYKYEWYKDGILISIDTANYAIHSFFTINSPGTYRVVITDTSSFTVCTACPAVDDEIVITTNTVAPINANFCAPPAKAVILGVDSPLSTFNWYNHATNTGAGALVASNTNTFTTPLISTTTTYYVEDTRVFTYTNASTYTAAGGTGLTAQSVWSSGTPIHMTFTVEKTLTIKTVTVNMASGTGTLASTISIAGPGGPYTHAVTLNRPGTTVVTLNRTLGPGTYTMSYSAGYGNAVVYSGATYTKGVTGLISFNNPTTSGYISTSAFFDWEIEAPTSCARIPVVAQYTGSCPLPVTFLSFEGKKIAENVELFWSTSQEKNSAHFEIERSTDGFNFTQIGMVDAAGNSSEVIHYHFTDVSTFGSGAIYYRLKQYDIDGSFYYSSIVYINVANTDLVTMKLFPNPVESGKEVHLNVLSSTKEEIVASVVDLTGKLVYTGTYEIEQGFNNLSLQTDNLPQGMYLLKVSLVGQATQVLKLIVN